MDPTQELLFSEHEIVLSAVTLAEKGEKLLARDEAACENILRRLLTFFRDYADLYHHKKEEEILFPEMNRKNALLEEGAIKEMLENHDDFRDMLKSIERFLDKKDFTRALQQLHIYSEALLDHIAVENDEIFQMITVLFDEKEIKDLYFRFLDLDRELGEDKKAALVKSLDQIRQEIIRLTATECDHG
jgi:hemerythrin-like domain-containing protein